MLRIDHYTTVQEIFKFWNLVRLMLDIWCYAQFGQCLLTNEAVGHPLTMAYHKVEKGSTDFSSKLHQKYDTPPVNWSKNDVYMSWWDEMVSLHLSEIPKYLV